MQTLDTYRQGIQDGEMWPGDGYNNVVSEGKSHKRKKVKYYCERHWQLKAVENQEDAALWI